MTEELLLFRNFIQIFAKHQKLKGTRTIMINLPSLKLYVELSSASKDDLAWLMTEK